MANADVITEKVYCTGQNCGNDAMTMALLNNNQWGGNNPFAYAFLMGMMRFMYGNDWQQQMPYNAEMQARFNQLSNQMSDNHNTDILSDLARGNYARIGELSNNLNIDHRAIQSGICDLRAALQAQGGDIRAGFQGVQGDVRFTGERVINANLMGVKDMQSSFKDCCCENRLAQKDTIIAMKDQTYTINERLTGIANGMTKGFSDIGYLMAQQKGELLNNQDRNTQRIVDTLNAHWKDELALKLQDQKFENSQLRQNIYMRDLVETGNGCGCGCN